MSRQTPSRLPVKPPPFKLCEHSYVCGLDALDGHDGKCILHSEDSDKDEEAFEEALEEHREEHGPDFRRMVFPADADFEDATFEDGADFENATFEGKADFWETTFEGQAVFAFTTFKDEARFGQGELESTAATFEGPASFMGTTFEGKADFGYTTFEGQILFRSATFEGEADFVDARFEGEADFRHSTFGEEASFRHSTFEGEADFVDARFKGEASFRSTFGEEASFRHSTFENWASFWGATFEGWADFVGATFEGGTSFGVATIKGEASFRQSTFEDKAYFWRATFEGGATFEDATFGDRASFENATFKKQVCFVGESGRNRLFTNREVTFTDVTYDPDTPPRFRFVDLSRFSFLRTDLRDVEFTGVNWCREFSVDEWFSFDWFRGREWFQRVGLYDEVVEDRKRRSFYDIVQTTFDRMGSPDGPHWTLFEVEENSEGERWREVERLYRQLKRNHEERGDFPRGGDFHIGEKESRRKSPETSAPLKSLLCLYRAFSKYGERATPAAISLLVIVVGCAVLYSIFGATLAEEATARSLGIANPDDALSFSESLRVSLEASFYPVRPVGFEGLGPYVLSVFQRLLSPFLLALLALALRQRVKR